MTEDRGGWGPLLDPRDLRDALLRALLLLESRGDATHAPVARRPILP